MRVTTFPNLIHLKVNVIVWMEFELANYVIVDQHVIDYATGSS